MIQINVEPETGMIAIYIVCACQRPEGAVVGITGEDVRDLRKLRGIC